jgi:hypothetical protein
MLFVADRIPAELRRIVEFLNEQMDPAEMLALELQQFSGEGLKTIVPTVFGQTEDAQQRKSVGASNKWTIAGFRARKTLLERRLETAPEAEKPQIKAQIADYEAKIAAAASGANL